MAKKHHKGNSKYLNEDDTFKGGYDGAVKYFMSEDYSKESAKKIAGKIAARKGKFKKSLNEQALVDAVFAGLTEHYMEKGLEPSVARNKARRVIARQELKKSLTGISYNELRRQLTDAAQECLTVPGEIKVTDIYEDQFVVKYLQRHYIADYEAKGGQLTAIGEFHRATEIN